MEGGTAPQTTPVPDAVGAIAAGGAPTGAASAWGPLRHSLFRALWIASVASNVGTWIQSVAAVWMMTSLSPAPAMTALVQTAGSLPLLLLSLPAGALADMVDRRRLLIASQAWMLATSAALALLTRQGLVHPWILLGLTFAMGIGAAMTGPAWLAITLELVPRSELAGAVTLGSASMNLARAVGPAIGGLIVALWGPAAAFALNAASFVGVISVLVVWRRVPVVALLPREHVFGAIRAGLRFVRYSPALNRILTRVALFVLSASALWALLPVLARREMHLDAAGYGALLGAVGIGAVAGAGLLPLARTRLSLDRIVDVSGFVFAGVLAVLGLVPSFPIALAVLFVCGIVWMSPLSSLNVATQSVAPAWVRARALAVHLLVLQGGLAGGSALWGSVAERAGTAGAFRAAAASLLVATVVGLRVRLKKTDHIDLTPAPTGLAREIAEAAEHDDGPVLVTVEYRIDPSRAEEFVEVMAVVRRVRRRSGAWRWGLFADLERPGVYLESFLIESWLDHLRQHERMTRTDRDISYRARAFHIDESPPVVRHLIASRPIG